MVRTETEKATGLVNTVQLIEVIQIVTSPLQKYTEILITKSFFKNSSDFLSIILLTKFFFS